MSMFERAFERANRIKLRFATERGNITVEDLYDLPLTGAGVCLNNVAKTAHRAIVEAEEESFVTVNAKVDSVPELRLDIVKKVIKYKLDAINANERRAENKAEREKLMEILSDKKHEGLKRTSAAKLEKMIDDLKD